MMMMTTIRKAFLLSIFLCAFQFLSSQSGDFGIWYCFNADMELSRKLDLSFSSNIRTFEKASTVEQVFGELGLRYSPLSFLSLAGSYRFVQNREDDDLLHPRHKWFADIRSNVNITRSLSVSARFRFQRQDETYYKDANDEIPDYCGRLKIRTIVKTPTFPVDPYISWETYARMFEQTAKRFYKQRYGAGAEYKLSKKHSVGLEYSFVRDHLPKASNMSIIALTYNLSL